MKHVLKSINGRITKTCNIFFEVRESLYKINSPKPICQAIFELSFKSFRTTNFSGTIIQLEMWLIFIGYPKLTKKNYSHPKQNSCLS